MPNTYRQGIETLATIIMRLNKENVKTTSAAYEALLQNKLQPLIAHTLFEQNHPEAKKLIEGISQFIGYNENTKKFFIRKNLMALAYVKGKGFNRAFHFLSSLPEDPFVPPTVPVPQVVKVVKQVAKPLAFKPDYRKKRDEDRKEKANTKKMQPDDQKTSIVLEANSSEEADNLIKNLQNTKRNPNEEIFVIVDNMNNESTAPSNPREQSIHKRPMQQKNLAQANTKSPVLMPDAANIQNAENGKPVKKHSLAKRFLAGLSATFRKLKLLRTSKFQFRSKSRLSQDDYPNLLGQDNAQNYGRPVNGYDSMLRNLPSRKNVQRSATLHVKPEPSKTIYIRKKP